MSIPWFFLRPCQHGTDVYMEIFNAVYEHQAVLIYLISYSQ